VLDPTVGVFEALFCGSSVTIASGLEDIAPRAIGVPVDILDSLLGRVDAHLGRPGEFTGASMKPAFNTRVAPVPCHCRSARRA